LALSLLIPLGSCTTLSPITSSPEKNIPRASSPELVRPNWQPFAEEAVGGLDYFAGKTRKPRLEFRALRIDLSRPDLRIVMYGNPRAAADTERGAGLIPSTWVSGFVRRYGLLAGINAGPFDPVSGKEGEPRTNIGIIIAGGLPIAPPAPQYDALVFYWDGGAAILSQGELGDLARIENAVGGFHRILQDGRLAGRIAAGGPAPPRHPRSAAGLSAEGNYLYLLAVDGRRPGSIGATEAETGIILRALGAAEGINFDGGGSTSLALRFPGGAVRPVNIPIHGGIPGRERGVASCLGIGFRGDQD
jgi:hypothetical protein